MKKQNYTLTDNTIVTIAKLLQVAILTGTDIVDNLRTIELVSNEDNQLEPSDDFIETFESNIEKMLKQKEEKGV